MTLGLALPPQIALDAPRHTPTALREADLFRGTPVRVEPCACGDEIRLYAGQSVEQVVATHVRQSRHREYSNDTRVL